VTGNGLFLTIAEETLSHVAREKADPGGGFCFTQSADPTPLRSGDDHSEGEEGRCFVWLPDEIRGILGGDAQADAFVAAYGVTRHGNALMGSEHGSESRNFLRFVGDLDRRSAPAEACHRLFPARQRRAHRGRSG
jgi:uncharacterized protein YyaL (SSP411 family)